MYLNEVNLDSLYCMFKGEPGTRKSTQALSFPKPQYWFSWDQKMNALVLPMIKWGINPREIQSDNYSDWNAGRKKLETLRVTCPFKTIVIDSVTSCADFTLMQTRNAKKGQTRNSGASAGRDIAGIAVNEIEDYNAESSALSELIALTKDIKDYHKVNVILIAHVIQAEYKSATGQTHMSRTIVTAGKRIAPKIPAYCEEVYHFNIKTGFDASAGGQYALLTEHTGDDFARTILPIDKEILFGEHPLYSTWILPGINKLKSYLQPQPTEPKPTEPQQSQSTFGAR